MARRSRLNRKLERESKKNIVLSILGIVLVLFLLVKFGIPLLANFALFLSSNKDTYTQTNKSSSFISAPVLYPLPVATNSAKLIVTGKTQQSLTIDLYLNGDIIDKTSSDKKGNFSFELNLNKGENKIYVKNKIEDKSSDASEEFNVLYKDTPPSLSIDGPSDGQKFSGDQNSVNVAGSTDPQVKVTINGFWSIVNQDNKFSYRLPLQNGDNEIKAEATDLAGNKTTKTIKINYSP